MPQLRFRNERELTDWLRDTEDGRKVVDDAIHLPRINVLAVQQADCVELYAHRRVRITAVTRVHGTTPEAMRMTDELLGLLLPQYLRELYEPANLRATVTNRALSPQEYEWWNAYQYNCALLGGKK